MSDQQPPYAPPPPPPYAPPPPPPAQVPPQPYAPPAPPQVPTPPQPGYPAPQYPAVAPEAPKKKRTALIIAIVAAVLLLCCCGVAASLAALNIFSSDSGATPDFIDEIIPQTDARLEEWLAWEPEVEAMMDALPAEREALMIEALGILAPEFTADDAVWEAGYYDAAEDWYWGDAYYVRAFHPSSETVSAAAQFWIQTDEMVAEGVAFDNSDGDALVNLSDGRELLYTEQWFEFGFDLVNEQETALWVTIGDEWPDAVVFDAYENDDGTVSVRFTTWRAFAIPVQSPYVEAVYTYVEDSGGGSWELTNWEYVYPEDAPAEKSETIDV